MKRLYVLRDRRSNQGDPVPALHERLRRAGGGLMEFTAMRRMCA